MTSYSWHSTRIFLRVFDDSPAEITVKYVKTEDQLAFIGTKHLSKQRQRYLLKSISEFRA